MAKVVCRSVDTAGILSPVQVGVGVSGGAEAAIHAVRTYINSMKPHEALVKLDFANAFNSISRDAVLASVAKFAPCIFSFVKCAYSTISNLSLEDGH